MNFNTKTFHRKIINFLFSKLTKTLTFSNTDNFTLQRFLFAYFKFLNLALDLKVGVPRVGNDRF